MKCGTVGVVIVELGVGMAEAVRCGVVLFVQYLEANKDKKGLAKSREAGRAKTHWDFVIEEMTWLAKVSKGASR